MTPGRISAAIETEVREKLQKSHLLVWLDAGGHDTAFVDDLLLRHKAGDFPYPVVAFRGSFLDPREAVTRRARRRRRLEPGTLATT